MSQLLRGRYRREAVLGHGDAATTTLAVDTSTDRLCIVKSLRLPEAASEELVKHLDREARAYGELSHPRIPRLIDAFPLEEDGQNAFHLVMEHVPGRDLAQVVREEGRYDEARAVSLLRALLELLDRFHGHSPPLTHRAVKPRNVVIGKDAQPYLIDFGSWSGAMRRLVGSDGNLEPADTRGYTAPEQRSGRPVTASDVYALGATIVFALTGEDPAARAGAAVSRLSVSRRLRRVLGRMLAESLEERYAGAREVLQALDEPSLGARATQRPVLIALAATLAFGTVVLLRTKPAPAPPPPASVVAAQDQSPTPRQEPSPRASRLRARPSPRPTSRARPLPELPSAPPSARLAAPAPSARPAPPAEVADRLPPVELPAVRPLGSLLSIDVYRDFKFVAAGFPGGLGPGQTNASALDTRPQERLYPEPRYESTGVLYGFIRLGNGRDPRISFVLDEIERPAWVLWVDKNNNQDLTDDGPPLANEGSGFMGATVNLHFEVERRGSQPVRRPYRIWFWVNENKNARPGPARYSARFYAVCHYAGRVELLGESFDAVAFEERAHDGLLEEDGIWIDLDRDGKFKRPAEHFVDGEEVRTARGGWQLRIVSP